MWPEVYENGRLFYRLNELNISPQPLHSKSIFIYILLVVIVLSLNASSIFQTQEYVYLTESSK